MFSTKIKDQITANIYEQTFNQKRLDKATYLEKKKRVNSGCTANDEGKI